MENIKFVTDLPMGKDNAIKAMALGCKLTHMYFCDDEWMIDTGSLYEFEDGVTTGKDEFWRLRTGPGWNEGWKIYPL